VIVGLTTTPMRNTGRPAGVPSLAVVTLTSGEGSAGAPGYAPGAAPGHIGTVRWSGDGGQPDGCAKAAGTTVDIAVAMATNSLILLMQCSLQGKKGTRERGYPVVPL
jgi:hypothetical protein